MTYEYIVQGNYGWGHSWEDLTAHDNRADADEEKVVYDQSETTTPHRVVKRKAESE